MTQRVLAATLAAVVCLSGPQVRADVKVHALFGDGMVLQRGVPCHVWGTADPNEEVVVGYENAKTGEAAKSQAAKADKDGKWSVSLGKLEKPGEGGSLTIKGKNTLNIKDVYVGEVWICSGQSNMEQNLASTDKSKEAIENSANPKIRLFTVPRVRSKTPLTEVKGQWVECGPTTVPGFSAVAYYFGRDLQKALDVPIGLIHTSWGGTASEEWTSASVLEANPEHKGKHPNETTLYNGMIAPLIPYAIKGAIWYQGESNAGRAILYRTAFPMMIKNWRDDWKQGDFPFLFVQLAPFTAIHKEPVDQDWAYLREAQLMTMQKVPHTGMSVITDAGDEKDIHPRRKEPAGARLAIAARAVAYGEKIEPIGPVYDSMKVEGGKVVLSFKHAGKGLEARGEDGKLVGFTICGEDKKFHNAVAQIMGDKVIVSCDEVKEPVAVRFGWANYPVVNLWSKDGLPATPFRTDDFPKK
jgi:sialate O-acetylesterase